MTNVVPWPNHQLLPLEVDPQNGEPFLRLRKHSNIIITPPRKEDIPGYIACFNDVRVYEGLMSTPLPYLQKHAEDFFERVKARSDAVLSELSSASSLPNTILVSGCPVRAIREVHPDGTQMYIGDIEIGRVRHASLLVLPKADEATEEEKEEALKRNEELPLGDERVLFTVGDYLAPTHHGRGIMTDAINTLLWEWGVPRMGIRKIRTSVFEGNPGSVRVFEKNGFKLTQTLDNFMVTRGKMRNLHVLEWDKPTGEEQTREGSEGQH